VQHSWILELEDGAHVVELGPERRWNRMHRSVIVDGVEHGLPTWFYYREIPLLVGGHPAYLAIGSRRPFIRSRLRGLTARQKLALLVALILAGIEGGPMAQAEGSVIGSELAGPPIATVYELFVDGTSLGAHV
jgi:hypothetical protein